MDPAQIIRDIQISTSRSGGPGGQHADKTRSRVEARLNLHTTSGLDEAARARACAFFAHRLTKDGALIAVRSNHRSQHRNRREAVEAILQMLHAALRPQPQRKGHRTRTDKSARVKAKRRQAEKKKWRRKVRLPESGC